MFPWACLFLLPAHITLNHCHHIRYGDRHTVTRVDVNRNHDTHHLHTVSVLMRIFPDGSSQG